MYIHREQTWKTENNGITANATIHNGTTESHNSQRHTVHVASNHQTFAALMLCATHMVCMYGMVCMVSMVCKYA